MAERTVQVPVSLIESLRNGFNGGRINSARQAFNEWDEQSTPTASLPGLTASELRAWRSIDAQQSARPAPPRIEDMAPGTTFRARRNNDNAVWHLWCWTGRALMRIGASTTAQGAIGDMDIDPSTIRDVQVPREASHG